MTTSHDHHQGYPTDLRDSGSTDFRPMLIGNIQTGTVTTPTEGAREMATFKKVDTAEIVRLLADEALEPIHVQERLGISHATFKRHVNKALEAGEIERVERGVYRRVVKDNKPDYELVAVEEVTPNSLAEAHLRIGALEHQVAELTEKAFMADAELGRRQDRNEDGLNKVHEELEAASKELLQLTRHVETKVLGAESELQQRLDAHSTQIEILASQVGRTHSLDEATKARLFDMFVAASRKAALRAPEEALRAPRCERRGLYCTGDGGNCPNSAVVMDQYRQPWCRGCWPWGEAALRTPERGGDDDACMCGELIADHTVDAGHTIVSMRDYHGGGDRGE